ncbi:MAG: PLP-dependent aminotransferase family protein [Bacteroidales bacterium]|nr:PLP-dependent aminotransferase family protein [Bacteroidales bacterium]
MYQNLHNNLLFKELKYSKFFSDRMHGIPRSFIREILKVAICNDIISFAGGLPNRDIFPVKELQESTQKVFAIGGKDIFQYSNSEGYLPLREYIANRYYDKLNIKISPDQILITSGSQQGLDLVGKVLIDQSDNIVIEKPGYLGAIQAFSVYKPEFVPIPLYENGIDTFVLRSESDCRDIKLLYAVPDFQNPSGISYSETIRNEVADIAESKNFLLVEDTPYSDLRFNGQSTNNFYKMYPHRTILLGTFSKTVVPSFRMGWIVAPQEIIDKLLIAKQAADLHTNYFTQRVLYQYLTDYNIDDHISKITEVYGRQRNKMVECIQEYLPDGCDYTKPDGGMFLWITLPEGLSSMDLFNLAIKRKVAFVPGNPFYTDGRDRYSTLRLNFSCSNEAAIETGIKRLGEAIMELKQQV